MENSAESMAKILKAMANPIRLKILALCLERERTSRELREILGISKPLLIAHLRKLLNAGLLEYKVTFDEKRMIIIKYYRTKPDFKICIDPEILRNIAKKSFRFDS